MQIGCFGVSSHALLTVHHEIQKQCPTHHNRRVVAADVLNFHDGRRLIVHVAWFMLSITWIPDTPMGVAQKLSSARRENHRLLVTFTFPV